MKMRTSTKIAINGKIIIAGSCPVAATPCLSLNGTVLCDIYVDIYDGTVEPIEDFKMALKAMKRLIDNEGRVAVCCSAGCGRTGTAVTTYMMLYEGYTAKDALKTFVEARGCGPETREQYLVLAVADRLRRKGILGDRAVDMLELPTVAADYVELTSDSVVRVGGLAVDAEYAEKLLDFIIDVAGKKGVRVKVPVTHIELATVVEERLGGDPSRLEEVSDVVRSAMELEDYVNRITAMTATRRKSGGFHVFFP